MRIWSIHPTYLDCKGLVALWREGLLAQNVLLGNTIGYQRHPQLTRFKQSQNDPIQLISNYLHYVYNESINRQYKFDRSKISKSSVYIGKMSVTSKQLDYEWNHFLLKIQKRCASSFEKLKDLNNIQPHPIFEIINGNIEEWEKH